MKELSDKELWSLCLDANLEALGELYERFYPLMFNYGCKLTADASIVSDVIQDLFVNLMANHKKISDTNSPSGYLLAAIRNRLYNQEKAVKNHFSLSSLKDQLELIEDTAEESDEYKKAIIAAYQTLSPNQQEIIYLFYIQDFSHSEISEILGINYQSCKNRLSRSISILRQNSLSILKKDII